MVFRVLYDHLTSECRKKKNLLICVLSLFLSVSWRGMDDACYTSFKSNQSGLFSFSLYKTWN
jgi:hypothetical protein